MDDGSGSYAPRSPDLSQFLAAPKQTSGNLAESDASSDSYRPRSPQIPSTNTPPHHQIHYQYGEQQQQQYLGPPIPPLPSTHNQFGTGTAYQVPSIHEPTSQYHHSSVSYSPPNPQALPSTSTAQQQTSQPIKQEQATETATPETNIPPTMATQQAASSSSGNGLGPSQGIEIKTKFPVARIKRIMQADEEVGKVAQVTPVAVSKALELFMISLCTKSAEIARTSSSKRITAAHLKAAIEADDQFDFLNEITAKVAGGEEGAGEKKGRSRKAAPVADKSEGDSDEVETGGKKVKSTRGRKKKSEGE